MFSSFFSKFSNNDKQDSSLAKEIIQAFKDGEQKYFEIKKKELKGTATATEVNDALSLLQKGAGSPDAGSGPGSKFFTYSRELREILDNINKRSKPVQTV